MHIVLRLSVMMFVGFLPLSLWFVTLGTYLGANTGDSGSGQFGPGFIGIAYSTAALGAMVAPLLVGVLADRLVPAERLLFVLQLASAAWLWWLVRVESQTAFYWTLVAYFQCYVPSISLLAAIAFEHLPAPARQFAVVRTAGTVAWVVGGFVIGFGCPWWLGHSIESTTLPIRMATIVHLVAAAYTLTLPVRQAIGAAQGGIQAIRYRDAALKLLGNRSVIALGLATMLTSVAVQFYFSYANLFLNEVGVSGAAGKLSFGQIVEACCILLLPAVVAKLGVKRTFLIGSLAWVARYGLLAAGDSDDRMWMLYVAILLHGVSFTFVYITAQIYVDSVAGDSVRTAAQGLFAVVATGVGQFVGGLVAGVAQAKLLTPSYDWQAFWLVPCLISVAPLVLMAVSFPKQDSQPG